MFCYKNILEKCYFEILEENLYTSIVYISSIIYNEHRFKDYGKTKTCPYDIYKFDR